MKTQLPNPKSEIRSPKEIQSPKPEAMRTAAGGNSDFGVRASSRRALRLSQRIEFRPSVFGFLLLLFSTLNPQLSTALAQGTAFTYQGRLNDGASPANGIYDLRFAIYDSTNSPGVVIAGPLTNAAAAASNGVFTVTLDFGANIFTNPDRFLEIGVRANGLGNFTTLSPRQKLTPAPYAIFAGNVGAGGLTAGTYGNAVTLNNSANSFIGNGSGLANVNALTLGGVGSNGFWRTTGNAGTTPGANFLGTTDNQPLEIRVNGTRGLRIEPNGTAAPNLIGGYFQNNAGSFHAVAIAGGGTSASLNQAVGDYAFIGSGHGAQAGSFSAIVDGGYNVSPGQFSFIGTGLRITNLADFSFIGAGTNNYIAVTAPYSFIGGGTLNSNLADSAVIVGGARNLASGSGAFIGGGGNNAAENFNAVISGGANNLASANAATISGGSENTASGDHSTIGGGQGNVIQSSSAYNTVIAGGYANTIQPAASHASIGGGYVNLIQTNAYNSTIPGGDDNTIEPFAVSSVIGGGSYNAIRANAQHSIVAGGEFNGIGSDSTYSTISGGHVHSIQAGSTDATISGGEQNSIGINAGAATIGGGLVNTIGTASGSSTIAGGNLNTVQSNSPYNTIGGGIQNTSSDSFGTVGGGGANGNSGFAGTIGGGYFNTNAEYAGTVSGGEQNISSGFSATVSGGRFNTGGGIYAVVPGGYFNSATGDFSFAAGTQARASHKGSFVWADSQLADFASTSNDQFNIRAAGGVRLNTDTRMFFGNQTRQMLNLYSSAYGIGVQNFAEYFRSDSDFYWYQQGVHNDATGNAGGGNTLMHLSSTELRVNGTFVSASDRNMKENFTPVNPRRVLEQVAALPVTEWNYKQDAATRHLGPMAQDFYAAFGVGPDDKHISMVDADGVALAAIQGLNQKVEARSQSSEARSRKLEEKLQQKETEIAELKQRLEALERTIHIQKSN